MHTAQHKHMQKCIDICNECRDECQDVLVNHCLPMGGEHAEAEHVKLMLDCIQACQTAADFMARNSQLHASQCRACADVCEACAESCEEIGGKEMEECAKICWECAESCREMSKMKKKAA